jgi:hypothetical protein
MNVEVETNAEGTPKPQIATKEPTPRVEHAPGSVGDVQTIVLAAAEHEAFEECFSLPSFARVKRMAEIASDYAGVEIVGPELLAGGLYDVDGFSGKLFEAIYARHQVPWNGGPTRSGDPRTRP